MDYLKRCEQDRQWIGRHNRKVTRSILAFIALFCVLAVGAFQLNQVVENNKNRHINVADLEAYLDQKENKTVEDGLWYLVIGNVYYDRQNLERAASAYDVAIRLNPDNPDALNNLAWLLVTSDNPDLRNPQKALELAKKAIALEKAPHIWDTLAEALYANGRVEDAIEAENKALQMHPDDRQVYEKQLSRFMKARKD